VGDAKYGHIQVFVVEECVECLLNEFFGLAVEGGGGLIEDEERNIIAKIMITLSLVPP
jgi:hypothetical protein